MIRATAKNNECMTTVGYAVDCNIFPLLFILKI